MAILRNRKRPQADEPPQEHRPSKKIRAGGTAQSPSNFTPEFWDNLSKVWLTPRALRELDRRNDAQPAAKPPAPALYTTDLARFARRGGPDLRHLRGCPQPRDARLKMSSSHSSNSSRRTKSTKATTISSKARRSSAYDDNFEQHLTDHNIYLPLRNPQAPKPDLEDTRLLLSASRPSLSPSRFDDSAFEDLLQKNETKSEGTIMRNVIPIIAGNTNILNEGSLPFTNFESLTESLTVNAVPDFFDGAPPGDVDKRMREDLSQMIVPTKHANVPVAPNFFLEAKAPGGGADVARRQACLDGAYGARAMHSLQIYGEEEPVYDGNAYTYSSTYHAGTGTLQLYAHHTTAPTDPEGRQGYHMTQIDAYALTGSRKGFVEGATAFRNARDLARRHRDKFIRQANARASRSDALPVDQPESAETQQYGDSGSDEFVDCDEYVPSVAVATESTATSRHVDEDPTLSNYSYAEDEDYSQGSTSLDAAGPAMSFTTSFASSFSTPSLTRSKRHRASRSPPTELQLPKKQNLANSRTRHSLPRRSTRSSARASTSTSAAPEYWTWSDEYQLHYHLNEDGSRIWEDGTED
ncbi:hypothetical protein S7711_10778 [Stachybotrys chartarum IBT 7711]|uniref:Uncharacterized protein n=1 Tax=Stachybotrys chartarum (strain CBS 109288 / IBT 7711) TaxID=1280523 RepID=A0A084AHS6_STACB|nr:hypothetical protein S7711_10778 [Stachybotrys chartarum IBT 7711]